MTHIMKKLHIHSASFRQLNNFNQEFQIKESFENFAADINTRAFWVGGLLNKLCRL